MLISVIVPVYNVELYLSRCIQSIIKQTYKELEIILVDDGSTDLSGQLCEQWKEKDSRIIVIHKANGGLSSARNAGIEIAKGKYLAFVDSDDYIAEDMIDTMVGDIQNYGVDVACVNYMEFDDSNVNQVIQNQESKTIVLDTLSAIKCLYSNEKICNFAWNKMYKKELFESIRYPLGRKMEDLGTTYRLFDLSKNISYNSKRLYYYYQRENSILHNLNKSFYIDKTLLTIQRSKYLRKKYGDFIENTEYVVNTIFESYQYIYGDEKLDKIVTEEMDYIWKYCRSSFNEKRKIKILIFQISKKMFLKIFNKGKINNS
ncbi:glycosyltransferase [Lachnospira pectinoschiza]|uniref:glycosyltransferase family 2 protein n=1 Tax=Lachnospira pectinoschiza TaxID=28052 RepID=UPI001D078CD9|nr:glycosyltransferase [Lachnospira pectinoschiza]MCB6142735.1 glycosyltransferase [Lachnospira pectinoschiza]